VTFCHLYSSILDNFLVFAFFDMVVCYFCNSMDSLTHILVGAAVGDAVMGKRVGKSAMLAGAIAGNVPDVDALMNFFVSDLDSLILHRGITHSLFVALAIGPLLGWIWHIIMKRRFGHLKGWMWLFTLNIIIHIFLDTATMYGTAILSPFSSERFAFNNIFVVDPLFTLPLCFSVAGLLLLRGSDHRRGMWNNSGLLFAATYMLFTFISQSVATTSLERSIADKGISYNRHFTVPTLFNSFLWNVTVEADSGYWSGYVSVFDKSDKADLYFIKRNDSLDNLYKSDVNVQKLISFSNGFYVLREKEGRVFFNDLRFGQVNGWYDEGSNFGFSFDLSPGADNMMVVQQGRIEGTNPVIFSGMLQRIKGIKIVSP